MHGFFSVPVDHLHALRELATHFRGRDLSHATVVSPDLGYAKSAAAFARRLSLPVAAGAKERISDTEVRITAVIGDVAGRDGIVLDDEIARGTTVFELLDRLHEEGARSVAVACTHGLFVDNALDKLSADRLAALAEDLQARHRVTVTTLPADLSLPADVSRVVAATAATRVRILALCPGRPRPGSSPASATRTPPASSSSTGAPPTRPALSGPAWTVWTTTR